MQPSKLSEVMTAVRNSFEQAAREGEAPVLVTSASIRPFRALAGGVSALRPRCCRQPKSIRARLKTVGSV